MSLGDIAPVKSKKPRVTETRPESFYTELNDVFSVCGDAEEEAEDEDEEDAEPEDV